jgi:hypothetical protein
LLLAELVLASSTTIKTMLYLAAGRVIFSQLITYHAYSHILVFGCILAVYAII